MKLISFVLLSLTLSSCGGVGPMCPKVTTNSYQSFVNHTGTEVKLPRDSYFTNDRVITLMAEENPQNFLYYSSTEREAVGGSKITPWWPKRKYRTTDLKNGCSETENNRLDAYRSKVSEKYDEDLDYRFCLSNNDNSIHVFSFGTPDDALPGDIFYCNTGNPMDGYIKR